MLKHLAFLFLLLTPLACRKDDEGPGLPPVTFSGANTFGCLINGRPWVAEIGPDIWDPALRKVEMSYDETDIGTFHNHRWSLRAKLVADSTYESFVMTARDITGTGRVYTDTHNLDISFRSSYDRPFKDYSLAPDLPYQLIITKLDTTRRICSGLFECYVVSTDVHRSDTLHMSRGRFDIRYVPY